MLPYAITNAYDPAGLLASTLSANHRYRDGSLYENTPDTAYAYTSRADGQAASVTFRPDTAQGTSFTTSYSYDANQHLTSIQMLRHCHQLRARCSLLIFPGIWFGLAPEANSENEALLGVIGLGRVSGNNVRRSYSDVIFMFVY